MYKILYLYREIMPYNVPVIKALIVAGFEVVVVHDIIKRQTPYIVSNFDGASFIPKESLSQIELNNLAEALKPSVVFISDRTNAKYNKTALLLRRKFKTPVIVGCDSQWQGGRQWLNVLTAFIRHKRYYSHILVAGLRQFEYAKRLGFKNANVLWPLYSADINVFNKNSTDFKAMAGKRNILYVGRFAEVKGIKTLLNAWQALKEKNGATLTLVGNGPLKDILNYPSDVIVLDFKSQEELIQIASKSTCFVLPSTFEPWALVLHEFAAAGLPIIATSACGASAQFVINNYNGFIIESGNVVELTNAINKILQMDNDELHKFSTRSKSLSQAITPDLVANAILSVMQK